MLLKEKRHQIIGAYSDGARRSVFLANTNFLAEQQHAYLEKYMPAGINVKIFVGNQGVDWWSKQKWLDELENVHVRHHDD